MSSLSLLKDRLLSPLFARFSGSFCRTLDKATKLTRHFGTFPMKEQKKGKRKCSFVLRLLICVISLLIVDQFDFITVLSKTLQHGFYAFSYSKYSYIVVNAFNQPSVEGHPIHGYVGVRVVFLSL